jgi:hypothetical protein
VAAPSLFALLLGKVPGYLLPLVKECDIVFMTRLPWDVIRESNFAYLFEPIHRTAVIGEWPEGFEGGNVEEPRKDASDP